MKTEFLSLETTSKLARYEKAIKFIKNYIKNTPNTVMTYQVKREFEKILKILEAKK